VTRWVTEFCCGTTAVQVFAGPDPVALSDSPVLIVSPPLFPTATYTRSPTGALPVTAPVVNVALPEDALVAITVYGVGTGCLQPAGG
jgi:hypothetical protein